MKRKRIVVMGFMGSMPIAGVIWQHIHYIVGLQRLGHESITSKIQRVFPTTRKLRSHQRIRLRGASFSSSLAREFDFKNRWAFCARYLPGNPTAGLSLKKIRQLYREADAILNICGTQEFNDDLLVSDRILYIESDPGVEQIKIDKGVKSTIEYLRRHHALFTFGENIGTKSFPVPTARIQMAADAATSRDRSLENKRVPFSRGRVHIRGELVHQRSERHYVARQKISLEQIARISPLHRRAEKSRRNI